tara:strand:+ start:439 stop:684 length:246 start_codon:yes stop_codon:yes gene_type:complete
MTWKDILKEEDILRTIPLEEIGEFLMETLTKRLPMTDEEGLYEFNQEQQESIKKLRRFLDDALDEVNDLLKHLPKKDPKGI